MAPDRVRNNPVRSSNPLTVLLDTSFLLTMIDQRMDIDEELRDLIRGPIIVATIDLVERELQHIGRVNSSRTGGLARVALQLMTTRKYEILKSGLEATSADAGILSVALSQRSPVAVATVDRKLRDTLSRFGLQIVSPRRNRGLMLSAP